MPTRGVRRAAETGLCSAIPQPLPVDICAGWVARARFEGLTGSVRLSIRPPATAVEPDDDPGWHCQSAPHSTDAAAGRRWPTTASAASTASSRQPRRRAGANPLSTTTPRATVDLETLRVVDATHSGALPYPSVQVQRRADSHGEPSLDGLRRSVLADPIGQLHAHLNDALRSLEDAGVLPASSADSASFRPAQDDPDQRRDRSRSAGNCGRSVLRRGPPRRDRNRASKAGRRAGVQVTPTCDVTDPRTTRPSGHDEPEAIVLTSAVGLDGERAQDLRSTSSNKRGTVAVEPLRPGSAWVALRRCPATARLTVLS